MDGSAKFSGANAAEADFFSRAASRLSLDVPRGLADPNIIPKRGDHDADPVMEAIAKVRPIKPAAVLIPVVAHAEPTVILTTRTSHLADHAGQIAFPGGKIDAGDESPAAAALREAQEEIGLEPSFIEPVGYLDVYMTTRGFRIVPTIARVSPGFSLTLNRHEVEDAFEVPLAFLMELDNHRRHSRDWEGLTRHYYAIPFGDRYIWGVTAGILRNLHERIYRE